LIQPLRAEISNFFFFLKIEDNKISISNFLTFKELGADDYIAQNDEAAMTAGVKTLDLIIDTIPASHDINPPLNLAKKKGIYVVVGVATEPFQVLYFF
jgi:D-arabinose 1-dehydrogenase-like Zn-dependent alcohol dehydrogenase